MPGKTTLPLLGRDPNTPQDVHLVGRYALGVEWQDRHASIYPFESLRAACACPTCAAAPAPARDSEAAWPVAIVREGTGVRIRWTGGHETAFEGRALRQLCRCALCSGRDK